MQLLDNSIVLLTDTEKDFVVKVYKNGCPMAKYSRENFISRAQLYRKRDRILEKLAEIMSKMG